MSEENDIILEKQVDDEEEPSIKPVKNKKEPANNLTGSIIIIFLNTRIVFSPSKFFWR